MTTTAIEARTATNMQARRNALLALAEAVMAEDKYPDGGTPFSDVLDLWLPITAAAAVVDPVSAFNTLVTACKELSAFNGDPQGWLAEHELGTSVEVEANVADALQGDVDLAADALCGVRS